jgi:hypothetical protein
MRSAFIIKLARDYLRYARGALGQRGRPVGLFSLILTAVRHLAFHLQVTLTGNHMQLERAVCAYVDGVPKGVSEFSSAYCAEKVSGYMASCSKLDDRVWLEILGACDETISEPQVASDELADLSLLDQQRGMLFDFSSPIKA